MGYIEELAAREAARQNENRVKQAEAARVLDMNAGLAASVRPNQGYQANGLTDREANEVAQREALVQKAYEKVWAENYAKSNQYVNDKREAEQFGDRAGPDGKYTLVTPKQLQESGEQATWDAQVQGGADPVTIGLNNLLAHLINKPRESANKYMDNVDPGLAAKWMADRESFR